MDDRDSERAERWRAPPGFYALAEQVISGPIPDVVTLKRRPTRPEPPQAGGGVAVADAPPVARFVTSVEDDLYARKANVIAIKHRLGQVVAVIEIVSPGNKSGTHALRSLVEKRMSCSSGDQPPGGRLVPPSPRDPQGIHKAIWDDIPTSRSSFRPTSR